MYYCRLLRWRSAPCSTIPKKRRCCILCWKKCNIPSLLPQFRRIILQHVGSRIPTCANNARVLLICVLLDSGPHAPGAISYLLGAGPAQFGRVFYQTPLGKPSSLHAVSLCGASRSHCPLPVLQGCVKPAPQCVQSLAWPAHDWGHISSTNTRGKPASPFRSQS
jgi:hypothetical protein